MTINIGVIGAGKIVRVRHLPEIQSNPLARIAAICDVVEARKEMALEYDCKAYFDYQQMLLIPALMRLSSQRPTRPMQRCLLRPPGSKHVLCENQWLHLCRTLENAGCCESNR